MKANMCRKLKGLTSAPARLSVAMPLIFGLATIAAAPTVEAVTIESVNIIDGQVDVDQDNVLNEATDDALNVALWCGDHTPIQVDIINGNVDVNEGGAILASDDLFNCDLNREVGTFPTTEQVDILDGGVDVNEDGVVDGADNALNVQLFDNS